MLFLFPYCSRIRRLQPAEGHRFEPCNAHRTREIRTFCQTVMGSDLLLFLWKSQKLKNRENCWLRQSSPFFMQMHCPRLRFPLSDRRTPFLYDLPHFVFALRDCCGIAAAIVNSLSTELNFGLYFVMGVTSRFLNMKKPENFCWQEGEGCGILLKLSLRGTAVELKSGLKRMKKVLDKRVSVWYNK